MRDRAYGLKIASEIDLSGSAPGVSDQEDVVILYGRVSIDCSDPKGREWSYQAERDNACWYSRA